MLDFKKFKLSFVIVFLTLIATMAISFAENENGHEDTSTTTTQKVKWALHSSPSGSFKVRFPKDHQYKLFPFRISDNFIAYSGEILAIHDEKPYKNTVKSYLVKFDQTLGTPLGATQSARLMEQETQKYLIGAEQSGGTILSNEIVDIKGFPGREIHISYDTPGKREGLRIRIVYTDVARIQQVFSSSDGGLYAYRTNDFFGSIRFADGYGVQEGVLAEDWREFSSPHNIFTMRLPQKNPDYTPDDPKFKTLDNYDSAYMIIQDPVVNKLIYYNIHAYKTNQNVTPEWAHNFLYTDFVKKFVPRASLSSLEVEKKVENDAYGHKIGILQTKLIFDPHPKSPYIDSVLLKLHFLGNFIMVQEVAGGQGHTFSNFGHTLIESAIFHPQDYTKEIRDDINDPRPRKMPDQTEGKKETFNNDFPYLEKPPEEDKGF
ncbi:MAG: hypothetical protein OEY94_09585 [Alphaproteobacteria bacterium]|nr:hypothetical protein [Alphaproteobacteria bacterium]